MNPPCFSAATVPVVANEPLAQDTYRLRLACPSIARMIQPGQFVMLRLPDRTDPLLGRAFALYKTTDECLDLVYLVVGKMTRLMAGLRPGDSASLWGPLGNGFPSYEGTPHLVIVAGGIGYTPFLALLQRCLGRRAYGSATPRREVAQATVYYGIRSAPLVAAVEEFEAAGAAVRLASNDGSVGQRGFITDLLRTDLDEGRLAGPQVWVACGPEPMLHAVAHLARRHGIRCDVSLETPMACGAGICFSCVTRVATAEGWDYRRVCIEGPVFDAAGLIL